MISGSFSEMANPYFIAFIINMFRLEGKGASPKSPLAPLYLKGESMQAIILSCHKRCVETILSLTSPPFDKLVLTHNRGRWTQGVLEDVARREHS